MTPPEPPKLSTAQRKALAPPNSDIGPFYKGLAMFFSIVAAVLLVMHEYSGRENTWIDFGIMLVIVMLVLCLVRPDKFDNMIKTIADKLPFLSFKKDQ